MVQRIVRFINELTWKQLLTAVVLVVIGFGLSSMWDKTVSHANKFAADQQYFHDRELGK